MSYFNTSTNDEDWSDDEQDSSVFLSIGDLMSGLLMFFALLFVTALVQLMDRPERRVFIGTLQDQLKGNNIDVTVNQETGDISVRESILFDQGSAELKPAGKAFLKEFIPVYSRVIFSKPEFQDEITRVVIEGHTSSAGSYDTNLKLSLLRSLSVSEYIFSDGLKFSSKKQLSQKIIAAGRGEIEADQIKDNSKDRKVAFRFQFKGEDFTEISEKAKGEK
jgi:outer membrane protein OmpA-like peptidoglycan-associated protein